jgi:hypothetical protein
MTTKELIEILKTYPEDMRVLISGYEGGFDDVEDVKESVFNENVNTEWYYGKHEKADKNDGYDFKGIILY